MRAKRRSDSVSLIRLRLAVMSRPEEIDMVDDNNGETPVKAIDPNIIQPGALAPGAATGKLISDAAKRALFEAAARRKAQELSLSDRPDETAGPKGAEPTRFGDWERGGIAYDF